MGHIGFRNQFDHFIHAFHMPMFFIISGYFYKSRGTFNECVQKYARSLLIPYFSFGMILCCINSYKDGISKEILVDFFLFNTKLFPVAGALWFLTALFLTHVIYDFLNRHEMCWLIVILALIGCYVNRFALYPLPWGLSAALVGTGLYYIGHMIHTYESKLTRLLSMNLLNTMLFGAAVTVLIFFNGYINMRNGQYAIVPLFWIDAVATFFVGVSLSKLVEKKLDNKKIKKYVLNIGKNSVVYVCLNQLLIRILSEAFAYTKMPMYIAKIFILAIVLISLHWLSILFTRTRLKFFLGK